LKELVKTLIKHTPLYGPLRHALATIRSRRALKSWERQGRPIPPPAPVKQAIVKHYAEQFSIRSFVETGTLWGDMVYANKNIFQKIFSIELDQSLYERAKNRFSNDAHISILQGDSGEVIAKVLDKIDEPCLFWLDGHYSGGITAKGKLETPIVQELNDILNHSIQEHVILIDDARHFVGQNDYPTIEELKQLILKHNPGWVFEVKHDVIRACKNGKNQYS
jgi:hypothetical protein